METDEKILDAFVRLGREFNKMLEMIAKNQGQMFRTSRSTSAETVSLKEGIKLMKIPIM